MTLLTHRRYCSLALSHWCVAGLLQAWSKTSQSQDLRPSCAKPSMDSFKNSYHHTDGCHVAFLLQWRHNERDGVSNHHQKYDCLLNRLFRRRSKKTSKLCVTGLCAVTGEFPAQMANNAENVSIRWRHHGQGFQLLLLCASRCCRCRCGRPVTIHSCQRSGALHTSAEHLSVNASRRVGKASVLSSPT